MRCWNTMPSGTPAFAQGHDLFGLIQCPTNGFSSRIAFTAEAKGAIRERRASGGVRTRRHRRGRLGRSWRGRVDFRGPGPPPPLPRRRAARSGLRDMTPTKAHRAIGIPDRQSAFGPPFRCRSSRCPSACCHSPSASRDSAVWRIVRSFPSGIAEETEQKGKTVQISPTPVALLGCAIAGDRPRPANGAADPRP
jgi:hypothetical protein